MTNKATLEELGRGFQWHLAGSDDGLTLAAKIGHTLTQDGDLETHALIPESASFCARRVLQQLPSRAGADTFSVFLLDADPALAIAFLELGHFVTAYQCTRTENELAFAREAYGDRLEIVEGRMTDPVPKDWLHKFDIGIVDTLFQLTGWSVAFCRLAPVLKEESVCVAIVHPLERQKLQQISQLLGMEIAGEAHECIARVLPGTHLADVLWDIFVLNTAEMNVWIPPDKKTNLAFASDLDPEQQQHGCFEMHDVHADTTQTNLEDAAKEWADKNGWTLTGMKTYDHGQRLHGFWAYDHGAHVVITIDKETGRLACQSFPWSPNAHFCMVQALLEQLSFEPRTVRFAEPPG
jgi:hypothetical protein